MRHCAFGQLVEIALQVEDQAASFESKFVHVDIQGFGLTSRAFSVQCLCNFLPLSLSLSLSARSCFPNSR